MTGEEDVCPVPLSSHQEELGTMKNRDDVAIYHHPRNVYHLIGFPSLHPVETEIRNLLFLLSFTMFAFASWVWLLAGTSIAGLVKLRDGVSEPTAVTRNGSFVGVHDGVYDQDYFLGVPYALPPTGEGRFRVPRSLNESWTGTRDAKSYSKECVGYGVRNLLSSLLPIERGF